MANPFNALMRSVAPEWALRRAVARTKLDAVQQFAGVLGVGTNGNGQGYGAHAASRTKNSLKGWFTRSGSPDKDIVGNHTPLVERSRDLYMSSGLAAGAIKTIRTNVVGGGLRLNSSIDYQFLGLTREQKQAWEANTEREFRLWADSPACDAYRRMNFGQIQSLALISALVGGDCGAALPIKPRNGCPYDLRIKLIEGDLICTPQDGQGVDKDIHGGIELDADGEAVAAWIASGYGDAMNLAQRTWKRVKFHGTHGTPQFLLISQDWERIGQRRGVPLLAPVMETLKQLKRYTDAELVRCVVAGMMTAFIKTENPNQVFSGFAGNSGIVSDDQKPAAQQAPAAGDDDIELGNGTAVALNPGEDVTVASGASISTAFESFVDTLAKEIGAGIELPKELLLKHFTASYSASRAALLEAWKMFKMRRVWMVDSFVQPIYEQWLAEAVAKGRIKAPGFFTDPAVRAAWCGAYWYGPGQGHLSPLQEAKAAEVRVDNGMSTREHEAAEYSGQSWEDIHPVRVHEEEQRRQGKTIKDAGDYGTPTGAKPVGRPPAQAAQEETHGEVDA